MSAKSSKKSASKGPDKKFELEDGIASTPIVAGTTSDSIAAQRVVRGVLLILCMIVFLINIGATYILVDSVNGRRITYTPVVKRVTGVQKAEEASDAEVQSVALLLVQQMESYTDATVGNVYERYVKMIDPSLVEKQKEHYTQLRDRIRGSSQSRFCNALGAMVNRRTAGYIEVLVPYEVIVLSGEMNVMSTRRIIHETRRLAVLRFVQRRPTPHNKYGLFLLQVDHFDRADWLAAGHPDIWSNYMTSQGRR